MYVHSSTRTRSHATGINVGWFPRRTCDVWPDSLPSPLGNHMHFMENIDFTCQHFKFQHCIQWVMGAHAGPVQLLMNWNTASVPLARPCGGRPSAVNRVPCLRFTISTVHPAERKHSIATDSNVPGTSFAPFVLLDDGLAEISFLNPFECVPITRKSPNSGTNVSKIIQTRDFPHFSSVKAVIPVESVQTVKPSIDFIPKTFDFSINRKIGDG